MPAISAAAARSPSIPSRTARTSSQANKVLNAMLDVVGQILEEGGEVRLTGFGTFRVTNTKERQGRNPRTGEPMTIRAGRRVGFSASPRLLNRDEPKAA